MTPTAKLTAELQNLKYLKQLAELIDLDGYQNRAVLAGQGFIYDFYTYALKLDVEYSAISTNTTNLAAVCAGLTVARDLFVTELQAGIAAAASAMTAAAAQAQVTQEESKGQAQPPQSAPGSNYQPATYSAVNMQSKINELNTNFVTALATINNFIQANPQQVEIIQQPLIRAWEVVQKLLPVNAKAERDILTVLCTANLDTAMEMVPRLQYLYATHLATLLTNMLNGKIQLALALTPAAVVAPDQPSPCSVLMPVPPELERSEWCNNASGLANRRALLLLARGGLGAAGVRPAVTSYVDTLQEAPPTHVQTSAAVLSAICKKLSSI